MRGSSIIGVIMMDHGRCGCHYGDRCIFRAPCADYREEEEEEREEGTDDHPRSFEIQTGRHAGTHADQL